VLCLEGLGIVALSQGNAAWAVLIWGATDRLRKLQGIPMSPLDRTDYLQAQASARKQLGEETFVLQWRQGHSMTPEQALALPSQPSPTTASPFLPAPPIQKKSPSSKRHSQHLTARELQVLQLLARGLTDAQIAERLVISPRTVSKHVSTIYGKIGVSSRSAATFYAMHNELM
jgi:DNA-binding NarL/FixJ family response regulator